MLNLKRCLADYVREWARPERCDLRRIGFAVDRLIEFFGAQRDVATLKRRDGRDYRAARLEAGVVDSTVRRELGVLMLALRHAAREERLSSVPFMDLPKDGPARERWFTEDEIVRIMEQPMGERARLWLYIAMATGARKSAIETVAWKNVDLDRGYIDFRDSTRKETKKRRAKVKIADFLLPILVERRKTIEDLREPVIGAGISVGPEIKRILVKAGIDEKGISCHTFKHTFTTWAIINGATLAEVGAATATSIATLERHYLKILPQHTRGAVEAATTPPKG